MAKREQYKQPFVCSGCGEKGVAKFEENENPVYSRGSFNTQLISVSEGFNIGSDMTVVCNKCKKLTSLNSN